MSACLCLKDYDPYFTDHVPRQIYRAGESNTARNEKLEASSLEKGVAVEEEKTPIVQQKE